MQEKLLTANLPSIAKMSAMLSPIALTLCGSYNECFNLSVKCYVTVYARDGEVSFLSIP